MSFTGYIDRCTQTVVAGWSTAPELSVLVNGSLRKQVVPSGTRGDLASIGGKPFHAHIGAPLWLEDELTLEAPDGSVISPAEHISHVPRLRELIGCIDLTRPGLEFGPLDNPVVPKSRAQVFYLDHLSTEGIKEKYSRTTEKDVDQVCEVDFVIGPAPLPSIVGTAKYSWVIASHVGEHIANFIGWLQEISTTLLTGGVISLALPHSGLTWDSRRRTTDFADLVDSYLNKPSRPTTRQILDHLVGTSLWWGIDMSEARETDALLQAYATARHSHLHGNYVDVHCNTFTPESFGSVYGMIRRCGLTDLDLESVTYLNTDEFFVKLRKT